jgi:hypothetical protein
MFIFGLPENCAKHMIITWLFAGIGAARYWANRFLNKTSET